MTRCQCGTAKRYRRGIGWCHHCDEPHRGPVLDCGACRRLTKAVGIGPGQDQDKVS